MTTEEFLSLSQKDQKEAVEGAAKMKKFTDKLREVGTHREVKMDGFTIWEPIK